MSRLHFIPTPYKDESALSLIYRCATKNGFKNLADFSFACGGLHFSSLGLAQFHGGIVHRILRSDPLVDDEQMAAIDLAFPNLVRITGENFAQFKKIKIHHSLLRTNLALCPECIKNGHLNVMHTFSFTEICPIHGNILITQCPECKKTLDWTHLDDFHCRCSFDLRSSPLNLADDSCSRMVYEAFCSGDQLFLIV